VQNQERDRRVHGVGYASKLVHRVASGFRLARKARWCSCSLRPFWRCRNGHFPQLRHGDWAPLSEGVDLAAVLKRKLADDDDTRKEAKELFTQAYKRCEPALQAAKAELEGGQLVGIESLLGRWIEDFTSVAPTEKKDKYTYGDRLGEVSTVAYLKEAFFRLLSDEQLKGWVEQNNDTTELSLSYNEKITSLPDSLGECKALTSLNLHDCFYLKKLPSTIGELKNLRQLVLSECKLLTELPITIGELKNLEVLNLYQCSKLTELPNTIGELKNLLELELSSCSKLTEIPITIGELKKLEKLELSSCKSLTDTYFCADGTKFDDGKGSDSDSDSGSDEDTDEKGTIVVCQHCNKSKDEHRCVPGLPESLGECKALTSLNLNYCNLKSLPESLGECKALTSLDLAWFTLSTVDREQLKAQLPNCTIKF